MNGGHNRMRGADRHRYQQAVVYLSLTLLSSDPCDRGVFGTHAYMGHPHLGQWPAGATVGLLIEAVVAL